MKWTKPKMYAWSLSYEIHGRKNGHKLTVTYNDVYHHYYFLMEKGNKVYNSLWDNKSYKTEEECRVAAKKYCDKQS